MYKAKKLTKTNKNSRDLKRRQSEFSEEYRQRISKNTSPLENVFLSGKEIMPTSHILEKWKNITKTPFWNFAPVYINIENYFYLYLQEKYKTQKGVSIILGSSNFFLGIYHKYFKLRFATSNTKAITTQYKKIAKDKKFERSIKRDINNPQINLVVIPFNARNETGASGHAVVVIINKYLKTIEYYDSNGSDVYDQKIQDPGYAFVIEGYIAIGEYFKSLDWYEIHGYTFLSVQQTNPRWGIQAYGDGSIMDEILPKKFHKIGWCLMYCLIIIHYRIYYYQVEPLALQQHLLKKLFRGKMTVKSKGHKIVEFLLNYLIYIASKINDPTFIEKIQNDYPEQMPSNLKYYFMKRQTAPYITSDH